MSDHTGPTEPLRPDIGATRAEEPRDLRLEDAHGPRTGTAASEDSRNPVEAVKDPDNRAKLLLAIAALTLVNLLLLVAVLANVVRDQVHERVVVDGVECVVADQEGAESALYCQR